MGDDRDPTMDDTTPIRMARPVHRAANLERAPPLDAVYVRPTPAGVPAAIGAMMLPTEHPAFATRPHPVVLVRPLVAIAVILVVLAVALTYHVHSVVAGHHESLPWLNSRYRIVALVIAGAAMLRTLWWLSGEVSYYAGYRVVATNRRLLIKSGVIRRTVHPLGNTAMAASTLVQGPFGAALGYGSVTMPDGRIRDVRDPVGLFREMQGVANGVDGNRWTPALRQTRIP